MAFKSLKSVFSKKDAQDTKSMLQKEQPKPPKSPRSKKTKKTNKTIGDKLKNIETQEKRTLRILMLGPGDSGKTTIIKQMKKIHHTLNQSDLEVMGPYIQEAVIGYAKLLCENAKKIYDEGDEKTALTDSNKILMEELFNLSSPIVFNPNVADLVSKIWADPGIQETYRLRTKYQIHDNVAYFLDKAVDICESDDYMPNFEDYIRIRTRTTGLATDRVKCNLDHFGVYTFEFIDVGGQRSERKKWLKIVSDNIDAVLYVVALSEYDLNCFEDNKTNRLHEAINLFKEIINGKIFRNKSVMLFFNKYDLFEEKIKTIPITCCFDDYPINELNPHDPIDVVKFVAQKFLTCFDGSGIEFATPLHIHRTTALNTDNVSKLFSGITIDLVKLNLKQCGML